MPGMPAPEPMKPLYVKPDGEAVFRVRKKDRWFRNEPLVLLFVL